MSTQHIFLSPHFDDAVLSCGGSIAQLSAAGEDVIVASIFGGKPNTNNLSAFASQVHGRPLAGDDLLAKRRREDRQALTILHVRGRPGHELDAIYRQDPDRSRWLYDSEVALFGRVDPSEAKYAMELAQLIAALAPPPKACLLYAPLAIGNHVDHQLVRQAAEILLEQDYAVRFYEDYPYVVRDSDGLHQALSRKIRDHWQAELVPLNQFHLDRKIAAISAYRSQLAVLFGEQGQGTVFDVPPAVAAFAELTAGSSGRWAERLWCPTEEPAPPEKAGPVRHAAMPEVQAGKQPESPAESSDREQATLPSSENTIWQRFVRWLSRLFD